MNQAALDILRLVVVHGGIRAAARAAGLSPSTISRKLRFFEEELGLSIIERVDGRVAPSAAAGALLRLGADLEAQWDAAVRAFKNTNKSADAPVVRLGAFSSALQLVVLDAVRRFQESTPFRAHLVAVEPEQAWNSVLQRKLDAAISVAEFPHERNDRMVDCTLWRERFILLTPISLQSSGLGTDLRRTLMQTPWVFPPDGSIWDRLVQSFFRRVELRPHTIGRSDDWHVMQQMAARLDAATLVPATTFSQKDALHPIALSPALLPTRTVTLIAPSGSPWLPSLLNALLSSARVLPGLSTSGFPLVA